MKKSTNHGARDPSRVAPSTDMHSISDNSMYGNSMFSESIPRTTNHDAGRRATRHVLKPGHVYFLQPPLALPAVHDHGTPFSDRGEDENSAEIETAAACSDDSLSTLSTLSTLSAFFGPLSTFSASSGAFSTLSEFSGPLSTLSAGTAGVQHPRFLSHVPSPSLHHTPSACCGNGGHPTTASATHSPHLLNYAHSLPPFASDATHTPSPSPLPPPSPSADSPCCSSHPTRGHSRPGKKNTNTVPENPSHINHAAAATTAVHAFAPSVAQESCSSHLMHRGRCTASCGASLESWTGKAGKSGKAGMNSSAAALRPGDSAAAMAAVTAAATVTATSAVTSTSTAALAATASRWGTSSLNNYRPITLLNFTYKVLARVMADRMKSVLHLVISPEQYDFILGRRLSDAVAMVADIIDMAKNHNEDWYLLLVDFQKAFDSVSRDFLFEVLEKMGFPQRFVGWIKGLHQDTTTKLLINGWLGQGVDVVSKVRQGCPLVLYPFLCALEPLALEVEKRKLGLEKEGHRLGYLGYADDTTFVLQGRQQIAEAEEVLDKFEKAAGLATNKSKSVVLPLNANLKASGGSTSVFKWAGADDAERLLGAQVYPPPAEIWVEISRLLHGFTSGNRVETAKGFILWSKDLLFTPREDGGIGVRDPEVVLSCLAAKRVGLFLTKICPLKKDIMVRAAGLPLGAGSFIAHEKLLKHWGGRSIRWKQTADFFMRSSLKVPGFPDGSPLLCWLALRAEHFGKRAAQRAAPGGPLAAPAALLAAPCGPLTANCSSLAAPCYCLPCALGCPASFRSACCATMASLCVLAFDHEGRPIQFDTWLDDLQLYLLSDSRDSVSLFDHSSGAAPTPPATAVSATRSQWLTRDAAARLAIRNHLPLAECAHFEQHRTTQALYDAVVARYSSPATGALGRLLLPYLFPELSAFATVEDLHLLVAETSVVAVGAARGTPRAPFFEGCSPSPLAPSYASAAAVDVPGAEDVGAASASAKRRSSKGKGGRGGGGGGGGRSSGGGGSGGSGGGSGGFGGGGGGSAGSGGSGSGVSGGGRTGAEHGGSGGGQRQRPQRRSETPSPQQLREWLSQRGASGGSGSCPY
ncbi:unnamed protein product, partial [Closterium sp. NIES-54]